MATSAATTTAAAATTATMIMVTNGDDDDGDDGRPGLTVPLRATSPLPPGAPWRISAPSGAHVLTIPMPPSIS